MRKKSYKTSIFAVMLVAMAFATPALAHPGPPQIWVKGLPSVSASSAIDLIENLISCDEGTKTYTGASTTVARNSGTTSADEGVLFCTGDSTSGGGFLPFSAGNTIEVLDGEFGHDVAFQACIDNDGDRDCHAGPPGNPCEDQIFFSHSDDGSFHNPLGPLPASFKPGCPGGYKGYVIFLCQGEHLDASGPHAHLATDGTISGSGSTGPLVSGTFCGSPPPAPAPRHEGPGVKKYFTS